MTLAPTPCGLHATSCDLLRCLCVLGASNLLARQREGPADLRGQRGLHPAPLRLPTGHPRLGEEHAGALREGQPGVQVQGQEVGAALCCPVSPTGVPPPKIARRVFVRSCSDFSFNKGATGVGLDCIVPFVKSTEKRTLSRSRHTLGPMLRLLRHVLQDTRRSGTEGREGRCFHS